MSYKQQMNYENAQRAVFEDTAGYFDIPVIKPLDGQYRMGTDWISFNYAMTERHPEGKGCHFYLDDYQFARLWNNPDRYIDKLRKFKYVLSPDFSLFTDFPAALNIFNHYRKHWVARYFQDAGVNIIPTICWSDEDSFDWCFDGEPENSVVSVSSTGVCMSKRTISLFMDGYSEMLQRLNPQTVLFFGKPIIRDYMNDTSNVIFIEDKQAMRFREIDLRKGE